MPGAGRAAVRLLRAAGAPGVPGCVPAQAARCPRGIPGFGAAALLPTADGLSNASTPIHLEAGVATPMSITVAAGRVAAAPLQVRLSWMTPDIERARIDEAVAAREGRARWRWSSRTTKGRRDAIALPCRCLASRTR